MTSNTLESWDTLFHASSPELAAWANEQLTPEMREMLPLLPAHKRPYVEEVDATCDEHGPYKAKYFGFGKYAPPEDATDTSMTSAKSADEEAGPKPAGGMLGRHRGGTVTKCPHCQAAKYVGQDVDDKRQHTTVTTESPVANIPARYQNKTLKNFQQLDRQGSKRTRDTCVDYVMNFANADTGGLAQGRSLLLVGKHNTGKTHAACAIAKGVAHKGYQAHYVLMKEMTRSVTETWAEQGVSEAAVYKRYQAPDLLVIDDVTTVGINAADKRIFCEIIDKRYNTMKPTIIVSRDKVAELKKTFNESPLMDEEEVGFDGRR